MSNTEYQSARTMSPKDLSDAAGGAGVATEASSSSGHTGSKWKMKLEGMGFVILSVIIVSLGVTVALLISIFMGHEQIQPHGAVVVADEFCGKVGVDLMKNGKGNAMDSAVATALCLSVTRPDAVSLAGCGAMLVHDRNKRKSTLFDFLCTAPSTITPGSMVGVPGFVRGLYEAHKQFGDLSWDKLFDGAIKAASGGFKLHQEIVRAAETAISSIPTNPVAKAITQAGSGNLYIPSVQLQSSLRSLARYGPDWFYEGQFRSSFMDYMKSKGSSWKVSDLTNYKVLMPTAIQMGFAGFTLDSFPSPVAGGPFLLSLLGNVDLKNHLNPLDYAALTKNDSSVTSLLLHRLIEFAKLAEAKASTLGDPNDASIASDALHGEKEILDPVSRNKLVASVKDTAVLPYSGSTFLHTGDNIGEIEVAVTDPVHLTVVSNLFLGSPFGSGEEVTNTGVHLNSALKLFTTTSTSSPKPLNTIRPGRRPLLPVAPVYMAASAWKCGIRMGVASSKLVAAAQAMLNAAFLLRGAKCELPETAVPSAALESQNPSSPVEKPGDFTPAVHHGCIDARSAISLPRLLLDFSTTNKNIPVLFESGFETNLNESLKSIGHDIKPKSGDWADHVSLVGWNGYELIAFGDQRGRNRLHTY